MYWWPVVDWLKQLFEHCFQFFIAGDILNLLWEIIVLVLWWTNSLKNLEILHIYKLAEKILLL